MCAEMSTNLQAFIDKEELSKDLLVDGQPVAIVSPQPWLQPITCEYYQKTATKICCMLVTAKQACSMELSDLPTILYLY